MINRKKVTKKKVAVKSNVTPLNPKLHVVLGDSTMVKFERKCKKLNMRKSDVTRVLIDFFNNNELEVTPATATRKIK